MGVANTRRYVCSRTNERIDRRIDGNESARLVASVFTDEVVVRAVHDDAALLDAESSMLPSSGRVVTKT